jgi:hypothetical protein
MNLIQISMENTLVIGYTLIGQRTKLKIGIEKQSLIKTLASSQKTEQTNDKVDT